MLDNYDDLLEINVDLSDDNVDLLDPKVDSNKDNLLGAQRVFC